MKIYTIDQQFLGAPEVIASYLVEAPDSLVLIETGPASTQRVLEASIRDLGFALEDVRHVLVTHIHLDHSGGAGHWAARGSQIYVHPKGGRHLISPDRLLASAARIYGERMDELWGTTLPVPEQQVTLFEEGSLPIGGLMVKAWDTPGHAGHHLAFQLSDALFTGDVAGCKLPRSTFPSVPGPPPEFDLPLWKTSLAKLRATDAGRLYLTHFGEVEEPGLYLEALEKRLEQCVEFVESQGALSDEQLEQAYSAWDREQAGQWGVTDEAYARYEKANPSFMSAQGIRRWVGPA